ncbi:hypothetical protein ACFYOK_00310 [Microbispora bryophytorum]|uniref:hypothetical protein n=1 Tax=Microbispora bryophytorum TaxID=1460882 RepID=UPI0033D77184
MGPGNIDVSIPARHRGTVTTLIGEAPEPEPGTTVITSRDNTCSSAANRSRS